MVSSWLGDQVELMSQVLLTVKSSFCLGKCSCCVRDPDLEVLDVLFLLGQPLLLLFLGSRLVLTQFLRHIQFYFRLSGHCYTAFYGYDSILTFRSTIMGRLSAFSTS